jgi:hypothetical protein
MRPVLTLAHSGGDAHAPSPSIQVVQTAPGRNCGGGIPIETARPLVLPRQKSNEFTKVNVRSWSRPIRAEMSALPQETPSSYRHAIMVKHL